MKVLEREEWSEKYMQHFNKTILGEETTWKTWA
jgi:hypothetical protein